MTSKTALSTSSSKGQSSTNLAAAITYAASKQSYSTIRFLVDRARVADAYRAYAYFRWVDDYLDQKGRSRETCKAFIKRQQKLLDDGYGRQRLDNLSPQEQMLAELVEGDTETNSGLQIYLRHMMAVMAFDAGRRGELISQTELDHYTYLLASAVTEALHYFIGHQQAAPQTEARYLAATAAHITHMLRDTLEDVAVGYYNLPREYLQTHHLEPDNVQNEAYRRWVRERVELARHYFNIGLDYLAQVQNRRCRLAGYLYTARFEMVLTAIERDAYVLRECYPECKTARAGASMTLSMLARTLLSTSPQPATDSFSTH